MSEVNGARPVAVADGKLVHVVIRVAPGQRYGVATSACAPAAAARRIGSRSAIWRRPRRRREEKASSSTRQIRSKLTSSSARTLHLSVATATTFNDKMSDSS
eukprot:3251220-Pleurochrysis_carterae.AAC.3